MSLSARASAILRLAFVIAVGAAPFGAARAEDQLLLDSVRGALGVVWAAQGELKAERGEGPALEEAAALGPAGQAVKIQAEARSVIFTKSDRVACDWPATRSLSLWVYRSPEEAERRASTTIEVQFYEKNGKSRFWRVANLEHTGWKQVRVPLSWTRWGGNYIPEWKEVNRLAIFFRTPGELWIDSIAVEPGTAAAGAEITVEELAALAFPGEEEGTIRRFAREPVLVLTNAPKLEGEELAAHLLRVTEAVEADLPFLEKPAAIAPLLVFAEEEQYRQFIPRLAEQLASQGRPPTSGGFTTQGIATSSWSEEYGTLRPVFAHEYVHALLADRLRIANSGEWLHEGIAVRYQLRFHPQENFAALVRGALADPAAQRPLVELTNGEPISTRHYWQAATLVDWLFTEKNRPRLHELVKAMREAGSTNLSPHVETVLGTNWKALEAEWREYCETTYAP